MTLDNRSTDKQIEALNEVLQHKIPHAQLTYQELPLAPDIKLALIDSGYPQADLCATQVEFLMDHPPYWAFCWASGQVMARYIMDNPEVVKGKHIIDFDCGSGVVAIAAKKAGAAMAVAVDIDSIALLAAQLNAQINSTSLAITNTLDDLPCAGNEAVLLIADVFYDEMNIPMLAGFIDRFADVIIADSRVKPSALSGVTEIKRYTAFTVPDLDESSHFNSVGIYRVRHQSFHGPE